MKQYFKRGVQFLIAFLSFGLTLYILEFLLHDLLKVHKIHSFTWYLILLCFAGFYISGVILRKQSFKFLSILLLQLFVFIYFNKFFFPVNIILMIYASFALLLTRKEVKRSFKLILAIPFVVFFLFNLFSKPFILKKENFGYNSQGKLVNANIVWDFTNNNKIPLLTFSDQNQKHVNLESYLGKKIVISFWATWCGPCLVEKPELEKIKNLYSNKKDLVFIDISLDQNKNNWINFLNKNKPKGIQLISTDIGKDKSALNISGIPYQIIVNEKGNYKSVYQLHKLNEILLNDTVFEAYINAN
ncbi:TlpA disulfide reductase family protein [Aureibaculum sp. 2210JD6-5]|uniref:TlpA family protein disulfide reductase n=1 Tax=Aureibaculum sp. 2210JD6-5 TaxID=3103957 RepID=UPI002AAC5D50|nr:TlpA disulfide reductase family protein [Aureibaculum sp. 2210JD6-5]MDY7395446.1 TlpA disulfide reductase family protein [Aureibaculum sp. 2210JD6-5]